MQLPPNIVNEIAQELQIGMRCYVHQKTGEWLSVLPEEAFEDIGGTEDWQEILDKLEQDSLNYFEIEQMPTYEAFQIMEDFSATVPRDLQIGLLIALEGRKPFQKFKNTVDDSGIYREYWFAFRDKRWKEWVRDKLDQIP